MQQKNRRLAAVVLMAGALLAPFSLKAQLYRTPSVTGEVTAIKGAQIRIKAMDGTVSTLITTNFTRITKGHGNEIEIADLKIGDGIIAAGQPHDRNSLNVTFIDAMDAAVFAELRANMGKTYISGKVTKIDARNSRMKLTRLDGKSQTIGVDASTSLKRSQTLGTDGESLTLAKIKVGDNVGGPGSVKNGVFVPTTLTVALPDEGLGRGGSDSYPDPGWLTPRLSWSTPGR